MPLPRVVSISHGVDISSRLSLTQSFLGEILVLLVTAHLVNLLRHSLDMQDDQLVQIAVAELAHTQSATNTVLVLLVELQHVNVLVHVIMNLPGDCKMIRTLRGRTDDAVATLDVRLREFGLGLV